MNVLIINQFADNKGDRAILHFLVQSLTRLGCGAITVSTSNPSSWKNNMSSGVRFIDWAWKINSARGGRRRIYDIWMQRICFPVLRSAILRGKLSGLAAILASPAFISAARKATLVISTGGHHFTNWFHKNGMSPQVYDLGLASLVNERILLWSQSIGPLQFTEERNEQLIGELLRKSWKIVLRDDESTIELERLGVDSTRVMNSFDSVFGLMIEGMPRKPTEREKKVGVAIYTGPERDMSSQRYINIMAELLSYIVAKKYRVEMFPMQMANQTGDDRTMLRQIKERVNSPNNVVIVNDDLDTNEHIRRVSDCRIFIAHKTHGVVFSLVSGTPVIAIAYHKKTRAFMKQFGMERYVIEENNMSAKEIIRLFTDLEHNIDNISEHQRAVAGSMQQSVNQQFSSIINSLRQ